MSYTVTSADFKQAIQMAKNLTNPVILQHHVLHDQRSKGTTYILENMQLFMTNKIQKPV